MMVVILAVHPHMRGENREYAPKLVEYSGTPPHAWGKRGSLKSFRRTARYTPTCVGKTHPRSIQARKSAVHPHMRGENPRSPHPRVQKREVHPHMRGENIKMEIKNGTQHGTPPHAWGKRTCLRWCPPMMVGTPPHAWGKQQETPEILLKIQVHPHMRGENGCYPTQGFCYRRYTPTCVGKTSENPALACRTEVHPHMRGENGLLLIWRAF